MAVTKPKESVEKITEYTNIPVVCSKCGDKIRTDMDNKVYCANNDSACPLV
jgi:translation initiation factor 2 beta subunit (eIF-2beta)/eIF-5